MGGSTLSPHEESLDIVERATSQSEDPERGGNSEENNRLVPAGYKVRVRMGCKRPQRFVVTQGV